MGTNEKGGGGNSNIALVKECPLAQRYIKSRLTLALAKKILLPKARKEYENKLQQMTKDKDNIIAEKDKEIKELTKNFSNQIKLLKGFLKDRIALPCSPLKGHRGEIYSLASH